MSSLAFPKMFAANKVMVVNSNEATLQDISLLLKSKQGEFDGDPNFGTKLVAQLFKNNSPALKSVIKDVLCDTITKYMPQVNISRDDIDITQETTNMVVSVKIYNNSTGSNDMYNISLTNTET